MIVSGVNLDNQMEVLRVMERVLVTELWSPGSVELRVHGNDVLMMETEVDVEHDVRSAQQLNGKVLVVSMTNMSVNLDAGSVLEWLEN